MNLFPEAKVLARCFLHRWYRAVLIEAAFLITNRFIEAKKVTASKTYLMELRSISMISVAMCRPLSNAYATLSKKAWQRILRTFSGSFPLHFPLGRRVPAVSAVPFPRQTCLNVPLARSVTAEVERSSPFSVAIFPRSATSSGIEKSPRLCRGFFLLSCSSVNESHGVVAPCPCSEWGLMHSARRFREDPLRKAQGSTCAA